MRPPPRSATRACALAHAALAVACVGEPGKGGTGGGGECDEADRVAWFTDGDGDGWGAGDASSACALPEGAAPVGGDCDDADPQVFPGAEETCNGRDDDCDGEADPGTTTTWYTDADGDGWGDDATAVESCGDPAGDVTQGGDCDDSDPDAWPGAEEACGDLDDDDCDGIADAGAEGTWYSDDDGDGWGHPGESVVTCEPPSGWVAQGGDCRPNDPEAWPGAPERCNGTDDDCDGTADEGADADGDGHATPECGGDDCDDDDPTAYGGAADPCDDGIDQDCDGADLHCGFAGTYDLAVADAFLPAPGPSHDAGAQLASGDTDGDGRDDLLVATMYASSYSGGAYLVRGPVTASAALDVAGVFLQGSAATVEAGRSIGMGDADGDGLADVLIGAPGAGTDSAFLFFGPVTTGARLVDADVVSRGEAVTEFGHGVDLGDVDGDGVEDLVIGAYEDDLGGPYAGTTYVVHGPLTSGRRSFPGDAEAILLGESRNSYAGRFVKAGRDLNGDGVGDYLVAAVYDSTVAPYTGSAFVLFGPASGTIDLGSADGHHLGESTGDYAGEGIAQGDLDGDGLGDVIVGSYNSTGGSQAGAAYVVYGPATGTTDLGAASAIIRGTTAGACLGVGLAAEDLDGDGAADLLAGAPGDRTAAPGAGAVFLYVGALSGTLTSADATASFLGASGGDGTGWGVAAPDLDGDGAREVAAGAPTEATAGVYAGAVFVQAAGY